MSPPATEENFYDRTLGLLRLAMALLAFAMELGAGLAVHEARRWSSSGEDSEALRNKLKAVRDEMIELGHALWLLENEGAIFENSFWRDFYRSLLTKTVTGAMRKLAIILISVAFLTHGRLHAAEPLDLVVLVDLSQSVAARDHDGQAELQKNLRAVGRVLKSLPAGSRVAIFGITDDSFGRPHPLLQADLSPDEGYFKERLVKGRAQLVQIWEERSRHLQSKFLHTDILGALLLASERFEHSPKVCRKMLVVFSDMRQATHALDLEKPNMETDRALQRMAGKGLEADLHGVDVYALGVDGADSTVAHWQELKRFWEVYFQNGGAHLRIYSLMRDAPM